MIAMTKTMRVRRRHLLKKRDRKALVAELSGSLGQSLETLSGRPDLEVGLLDAGERVVLLDGEVMFFEVGGRLLPTVRAILGGLVQLPKVTVDMGAVRHVVNGADVMRPGVTEIDDGIAEGTAVVVVDERHNKPLAVGVALMSSEEMRLASGGKVVSNKHHIGDPLWEFGK